MAHLNYDRFQVQGDSTGQLVSRGRQQLHRGGRRKLESQISETKLVEKEVSENFLQVVRKSESPNFRHPVEKILRYVTEFQLDLKCERSFELLSFKTRAIQMLILA